LDYEVDLLTVQLNVKRARLRPHRHLNSKKNYTTLLNVALTSEGWEHIRTKRV